MGSDGFTFEKIRDLILGEDIRRRSSGELSSESLYVIRGKKNIRDSESKNKRRSDHPSSKDKQIPVHRISWEEEGCLYKRETQSHGSDLA